MPEINISPLVSIVMPTYNREAWIGRAIQSIINQNYQNWELLIIDNESSDNTSVVVNTFCQNDVRIKYYNVKKSSLPGISEYLNYGMSIARGEFIARLDDDDEWLPDKIERQVTMLTSVSCNDPIISCRFIARTRSGEYIWPNRFPRPSEQSRSTCLFAMA